MDTYQIVKLRIKKPDTSEVVEGFFFGVSSLTPAEFLNTFSDKEKTIGDLLDGLPLLSKPVTFEEIAVAPEFNQFLEVLNKDFDRVSEDI